MITIRIQTNNDAFKGHPGAAAVEAARILEELSWRLRAGGRGQEPTLRTSKLVDYNGQTVGQLTLTGKEKGWLR
jgi:hypothetical protein